MSQIFICKDNLICSENGYLKAAEIDFNKTKVLTNNGFQFIEPIDNKNYSGTLKSLEMWGFLDQTIIYPWNKIYGVIHTNCLDRGSSSLAICRPYLRCWHNCPNQPPKEAWENPLLNPYYRMGNHSNVIQPISEISAPDFKPIDNNMTVFYDEGYVFGTNNKDSINKEIDLVRYKTNYSWFFDFMQGWHDATKEDKAKDKWNYYAFTKSKLAAMQAQWLFHYFGNPCAIVPYTSCIYTGDWFAVVFSKNKRPFHHKIIKYNNLLYIQVKKLRKIEGTYNFIEFKVDDNYMISAPFLVY